MVRYRFTRPILLGLLLLNLIFAAGVFAEESSAGDFIVKPYIQLGDNSKHTNSLEVVWTDGSASNKRTFFFKQKGEKSFRKSGRIKSGWQGNFNGQDFYQHRALIKGIEPGAQFEYKIESNGKTFQSRAVMRKAKDQGFTFAVFGDVGAGSIGQRKNVYQCYLKKPDLYLIPGDIAYNRGLVSEYLSRFFPIMNCDNASPKSGAPLLRETLTVACIGNHDIALSNHWNGVDFNRYPDALGYYRFWSQPLNGPNKQVNGKNTTLISADAKTQLKFISATKDRFPVMANFSFDYGNVHWLVLDANPYMDWTDKKMRQWVEADLDNAKDATWKFVVCHQPGFTIDNNHWIEQRMRLLSDIFERKGVSMVFSGHAHTYQRSYPMKFACRKKNGELVKNYNGTVDGDFVLDKSFDGVKNTKPDGVLYIISGAGGAGLYKKAILNRQQYLFNNKFINHKHSFSFVRVNGKKVTLTQISCDGEELDKFTVTK